MIRKHVVIPIVVFASLYVSSSCATFRHQAVPVTVEITKRLGQISKVADDAKTAGVMTTIDRQNFANLIMIPAIDANTSFSECLRLANCAEIPSQLVNIARTLQSGISTFAAQMKDSVQKRDLITLLSSAIAFINQQYLVFGGK